MKSQVFAYAGVAVGLMFAAAAVIAFFATAAKAADDPPLVLARDGYFYVNVKTTKVDGRDYVSHQMYVEVRIPAKQTHPYPIIMVHGGTMSGTNYTGTPDGREGWAQYFVRQGYAVYVVDQRRARALRLSRRRLRADAQRRAQQCAAAFRRPGKIQALAAGHAAHAMAGHRRARRSRDAAACREPDAVDRGFPEQQVLNRDALIALLDKIGPSILLTHSQAGAFGWPVADARPDLVKAILAIEPNGPPFYDVEFTGAPDYFKQGTLALPYGITDVPLTYSPPVKDASELKIVQQDKADGPDLVRCYAQQEPARQLPNLQKMPILVMTSEASYHAPYDHCTVNYLRQAGVKPT